MLLNCCYCPYIRTILKYVHHFANIAKEKSIQNIIDKISDKTIIVVTHRLSFVENFDRIFVVNDGKIVEEGTHQQLLDQQGVYESMYRKQNGS